jgi:hypothetical protein
VVQNQHHLIVNKNFNHITQRVSQQHVVVTSVTQLVQRELDRPFHAELHLRSGVTHGSGAARDAA